MMKIGDRFRDRITEKIYVIRIEAQNIREGVKGKTTSAANPPCQQRYSISSLRLHFSLSKRI